MLILRLITTISKYGDLTGVLVQCTLANTLPDSPDICRNKRLNCIKIRP